MFPYRKSFIPSIQRQHRQRGKFIKKWPEKQWSIDSLPEDQRLVWEMIAYWRSYRSDHTGAYAIFDKTYLPHITGFSDEKVEIILHALWEKGLCEYYLGVEKTPMSWECGYIMYSKVQQHIRACLAEKNFWNYQYIGIDMPVSLIGEQKLIKEPQWARAGFVYLIKGVHGYYKIGRAVRPPDRISQLEVALPFDIEVLHLIECKDHFEAESMFHKKYRNKRVRGEWFRLTEEDIAEIMAIKSL